MGTTRGDRVTVPVLPGSLRWALPVDGSTDEARMPLDGFTAEARPPPGVTAARGDRRPG